jgi:hypothetical protein
MKRAISYQLSAISLIFFCWTVGYAQRISSTELINNAKEYDGKSVVYAGEAVGDVMARGDFVWVNLNDGENAIGIWLNKGLAKEIQFTGGYHAKGDRLEITGVFQRGCIQHGGDMDIHAQDIRKISPGRPVKEELDTGKRNFTFILLGILLCLVFIFVYRQGSRLQTR